MAYPHTPMLSFPLRGYCVNGDGFGKYCVFDGVVWGRHMGEDCNVSAGSAVMTIGRGRVVYAAFHRGVPAYEDKDGKPIAKKRNWGGIVIVAHKHPGTHRVFYSLYGHLGKIFVQKGDRVNETILGEVGASDTPENGLWEPSHLHFGLYFGPWNGHVLPGYWKDKSDSRTKPEWWLIPSEFIPRYLPGGKGVEFRWNGEYIAS